jgi:hypothetical protein
MNARTASAPVMQPAITRPAQRAPRLSPSARRLLVSDWFRPRAASLIRRVGR